MSQYKTYSYHAEIADISKDGKQVRIYRKTEDKFRPDETVKIATLEMEYAKQLRDSLNEVI